MKHTDFKERLEEILVKNHKLGCDYNCTKEEILQDSKVATESLITLFEDYTKQIVGDYEITEENQDNGHDCYEKFCDYCDKGTRDDLRQTINQNSKTILRGESDDI